MRCIEEEIPFILPAGWNWTKINTIAFVTKLAGFEYTKNIAPNLCKSGIPLFKGKNVQDSKIIYEFESYIPEQVSNELSRSQITRKCILTPYVGTIGNIGIHDKAGKYHLGSNVGKVELYNSNETILEEYVVAYLKSSYGYVELTKHMKATAQASISIEAIRDVYIPIPPANEQKRIVEQIKLLFSFVDTIDSDKTDLQDTIQLTKSKILDLAIRGKLVPQNPNDEPASVLLDRIRSEKQELIKQGKIKPDKRDSVIFKGDDNSYYETIGNQTKNIDSEIPFDLPDGWEWCRLGNVFNHNTGKALNKKDNDGVRLSYITTSNVYWNRFELDGLKTMPFLDSEIEKCTVKKGDILVCEGGDIGRTAIWNSDEEIRIQNHIHKLRSYSPINTEFYFYMFYYYKIKEHISGKGIGIQGLSSNQLHSIIIPLPSLSEQKRIADKVTQLFSLLDYILDSL